MNKQKNDQQLISNRTIQMLLIFAIVAIIFTQFNFWAFWWIPFIFMGGGCTWYYNDEKQKRKNDDYDGDYV